MNILLLLAGGIGRRAETDVPKQFLKVNNTPVIVYTLRKFQDSALIDAICVVAHPDWIDIVKSYVNNYGISKIRWVVPGGRTGLESVKHGLEALSMEDSNSLLLVHDSVRPFITNRAIEDNVKVATLHDVAVTSVPCVETLVKVDETGMSNTQVPRDGLMRVMTPQTFRLSILRELFEDTDVINSPYPSTFALYMSKGYPIYCSYGSERNIKITYPEDIEYLKNLFEK